MWLKLRQETGSAHVQPYAKTRRRQIDEAQWAVLKQGIRPNSNPDLPFLEKLDQQFIYLYEP